MAIYATILGRSSHWREVRVDAGLPGQKVIRDLISVVYVVLATHEFPVW